MTSDSIPPTLLAASEPTPEPTPHPGDASPGLRIRRAREQAGLSVEDFAAQLKLAKPTLEALERDDFKALNEAVYVRGYYRKCAKALLLPEAELMAGYERLVGPKAPLAPTKLLIGSNPALTRARIGRDPDGAGQGRTLAAMVIAVLIGGGIWYVGRDSGGAAQPSTSPAAVSVPVPFATTPSPAEPAAPAAGPAPVEPAAVPASGAAATPAATESAAPALGAAQPTIAPAGSATIPAAPPAAAQPAPATSAVTGPALSLTFKSTSWVRVEDAEARVLLSGVIQSGDHQALHGKPPYSLFIGNGPGVIVEYDGKAVDLTPYIKQNQTARLSVP